MTDKTTDPRAKAMNAARGEAIQALKDLHSDEWATLLSEAYARHGVQVRQRLTGPTAEAAKAAKAEADREAKIAALEAKLQALREDGADALAVFTEA
jgi:glycerate kinase